jgi:CBS domain-containing protein
MNVSSILRRKGTHVETAGTQTTAGQAARRLTDKGVGSLVLVDEQGRPLGVLSERDLVRALSEHGPSASHVSVGELVRGRPATCKPEDSLRQVMAVMTRSRTRHLPVIAGEALVGIVSVGDVVKGQLEDLELEVGVLRDYARARV